MCGVFFVYCLGKFSLHNQWHCYAGEENNYAVNVFTYPWAQTDVSEEWYVLFISGFANWTLSFLCGSLHIAHSVWNNKKVFCIALSLDCLSICFGITWQVYATVTRFKHRGLVCAGYFLFPDEEAYYSDRSPYLIQEGQFLGLYILLMYFIPFAFCMIGCTGILYLFCRQGTWRNKLLVKDKEQIGASDILYG